MPDEPRKHLVGLTGNIATGKSAVMALAAERGAFTLDADHIVHEILDNDPSMQAAIAVAFGEEVRRPDGRIDRGRLAAIVFEDDSALTDLELMLHPAVRRVLFERIDADDRPLVFIEAIKLLESGLADACDQIWVTRCRRQRQFDRLIICRGLDADTAKMRMDAQAPQAAKVARADVVIDTNGTLADTVAQFERAWVQLPAEALAALAEAPAATPPPAVGPSGNQPAAGDAMTDQPMADRSIAGRHMADRPRPPTTGPLATIVVPSVDPDTTVRRARPADIPAVLLHIHRATGGASDLKRADLLLELSERSYLIGQSGTEISTVLGWTADNRIARIERLYFQPPEAAAATAPAVLAEVEQSAQELLCEIILAFPALDAAPLTGELLRRHGFQVVADLARLPRVWQTAVAESQPPETLPLMKVLDDSRLA